MLQAQVNGKFAAVDATQGYTIGSTAPNNHVLCGNGTRYVDAASCGTVSVPFYQTIQINGTPLTQRFILNFDSNFTGNDTSPSTTVHLASTIAVNISGTASALAAAPTQCSGTTPVAAGVAANGNANCIPTPGPKGTLNNVTGSRGFGTTYTNSGTTAMYVSGYGVTPSGSATSQINCTVNGIVVYSAQYNATVTNGSDAFTCMVPPGGTYSVTTSGTSVNLQVWTEFVF